jgi:hypothetical protein
MSVMRGALLVLAVGGAVAAGAGCGDRAVAPTSCTQGGKSYPIGATFPADDGCNTCTCESGGLANCSIVLCERSDASASDAQEGGGSDAPVCALEATYTFTSSHGLNPKTETGTLAPPAMFTYVSTVPYSDAGNGSCAPTLPACGDPTAIDVADLAADVADPDVQQAFAHGPVQYGAQCCDQDVLLFKRAAGPSFGISADCTPAGTSCVLVPPGVGRLRDDLRSLITQSLADPACAGLY